MKRTIKQFQVEDVARAYGLLPDQVRHHLRTTFGSYEGMLEALERAGQAFQPLRDALRAIEERGRGLD